MKISVELFGAAREFSKTKYLEFNFSKSCKIVDIKKNFMSMLIINLMEI